MTTMLVLLIPVYLPLVALMFLLSVTPVTLVILYGVINFMDALLKKSFVMILTHVLTIIVIPILKHIILVNILILNVMMVICVQMILVVLRVVVSTLIIPINVIPLINATKLSVSLLKDVYKLIFLNHAGMQISAMIILVIFIPDVAGSLLIVMIIMPVLMIPANLKSVA